MPRPEKEALKGKVLVKEEEKLVKVEEGKEEEGQWEEGTHMVLQPVVPTKQCSQIALYLQVIVQDLCLLLELQCYKNKQLPTTILIKYTFEVIT